MPRRGVAERRQSCRVEGSRASDDDNLDLAAVRRARVDLETAADRGLSGWNAELEDAPAPAGVAHESGERSAVVPEAEPGDSLDDGSLNVEVRGIGNVEIAAVLGAEHVGAEVTEPGTHTLVVRADRGHGDAIGPPSVHHHRCGLSDLGVRCGRRGQELGAARGVAIVVVHPESVVVPSVEDALALDGSVEAADRAHA